MNSTMLSDKIENFILDLMDKQNTDQLLLKRKEVADRLACAPSQVTYVINTRFSANDRFIVESRRGSGGYIKISLRPVEREEVPDYYHRLKEAASQYQTDSNNDWTCNNRREKSHNFFNADSFDNCGKNEINQTCTRYTEASIRQHTVRVIGCKRFDSGITAKKSK